MKTATTVLLLVVVLMGTNCSNKTPTRVDEGDASFLLAGRTFYDRGNTWRLRFGADGSLSSERTYNSLFGGVDRWENTGHYDMLAVPASYVLNFAWDRKIRWDHDGSGPDTTFYLPAQQETTILVEKEPLRIGMLRMRYTGDTTTWFFVEENP